MATFESAFKILKGLVSDFKATESYFISSEYSEAQVREDYINEFFVALGWDVRHRIQKNPYEQEVKVEQVIKVGKTQKRADYAFHFAPNFRDPIFFVEAKKPARNLSNPDDYFQAIRYGWNANTSIVVLTDFEEFHIIDSRFKPDIDTVLDKRLQYFHYSEYTDREKFAKIYHLFSHEAVENNAIIKYAESLPKPRGKAVQRQLFPGDYQSIDESFLAEIDEIRLILARAFKKSNPDLLGYELTEITHRTIDRLVFIRFLEDKLIEQEHYVSEFGGERDAWKDFIALSKRLDAKYNGVVFKPHFIDSKNFIPPGIEFNNICEELSHLNSPYDFDKIPIHILGSIYERFLGKVVQATAKRATIEEKPEVIKAGGVYYTPQYIVRYIVTNTVGNLIADKTPLQISKMRFIDISCGSGSFLISAFEVLLDYQNKWYQNNPIKAKSDGCYYQDGRWILSLKQKKNILLNNIYGVDIDSQAVEVTQLSLCLKLMEDESTATANEMQVLFHEKILPDLTKNIICGNSLVGMDFFDNQLDLFPEQIKKINAFNWKEVFPEVFNRGGFDAVIGNPPYVGRSTSFAEAEKQYMKNKYQSAEGKYELYQFFIEKSTTLIKKKGAFISLITPQTWLSILQATKLRKLILSNYALKKIIFLGKNVFKASVDTIIFIIESGRSNKQIEFYQSKRLFDDKDTAPIRKINIAEIDKSDLIIPITLDDDADEVLNSIYEASVPMSEIGKWRDGVKVVGPAKAFAFQNKKYDKSFFQMYVGSDINRYFSNWGGLYCCREKHAIEKHQAADIRLRNEAVFNREKILIRKTGNRIVATIDYNKFYYEQSLFSFSLNNTEYDLKLVLGLLNSTLATYLLKNNPFSKKDTFPQIRLHWLKEFPIKENFDNGFSDKIIKLVDNLMKLNEQLPSTKLETQRQQIQRAIDHVEKKIDELVYALYGLSKEEIEIIDD